VEEAKEEEILVAKAAIKLGIIKLKTIIKSNIANVSLKHVSFY
jgi:hypothetical protein